MNAADVLDGAADLISERGWTQGRFRLGDAHCAEAAITTTIIRAEASQFLHEDATWAVCRDVRCHTLTEWNDLEGQTADAVVAQLRASAQRLREEAAL